MHTARETKAVPARKPSSPNGKFSFRNFREHGMFWGKLLALTIVINPNSFLIYFHYWDHYSHQISSWEPYHSPVPALHRLGSDFKVLWKMARKQRLFLSCPKGKVLPKSKKRHLLFSRRRWRPAMRAACSTKQGTNSKSLAVCRFAPREWDYFCCFTSVLPVGGNLEDTCRTTMAYHAN